MRNSCPPGIVDAGSETLFGIYEAMVSSSAAYLSGALDRMATPAELGVDLMQWWTATTRRDHPQWSTPHRIVAEWPIARLRDFSVPGADDAIATLLLPPQAGHDSCIVDYDPQQSQIRTALEAGLTRVLSLDWVGATHETRDASIDDYLAVIRESVRRVGDRVDLVGDCQGGWLAVIYAALHPDTVNSLTIAGAPVDYHAGEPLIHDWLRLFSPDRDMAFYRRIVAANDGILPGDYQLAGFIAMQPEAEVGRQLQLLANIHDPAHVARYRTFETWFKHTQPIPGAFYLWIVEHLFQNNELVAGTLVAEGRTVNLADITCPVNLLAGTTDHITPPAQVYALADHVGTPAADVHRRLANGGHLGLFMGHEALHEQWLPMFGEMAHRSAMADNSAH